MKQKKIGKLFSVKQNKTSITRIGVVLAIVLFFLAISDSFARRNGLSILSYYSNSNHSTASQSENDTLPFPIQDQEGSFVNGPNTPGIDLNTPSNITKKVEYDPKTNMYVVTEMMGDIPYRPPMYMSFQEFIKYQSSESQRDYWHTKNSTGTLIENKNAVPKMYVGGQLFDRFFGGSQVDIRPSGNIEMTFGLNRQRVENPTLIEAAKKQGGFDFDMNINLNVIGKIGDKLKFVTNYNTQANFDFENQVKLDYTGKEDEILQKVEAGNVSLPLNNSLITGSQTLWGFKTGWKFGRLSVTTIASQQKSKSEEINIQGGAQTQNYSIQADQYEDNKHFFLSQFFRDHYNRWLSKLPIVQSGINITRIEVWVTNKSGVTENVRDIVACMDLGEGVPYQNSLKIPLAGDSLPRNGINRLYGKLKNNPLCRNTNTVVSAVTASGFFDASEKKELVYMKTYAKKLSTTEYTLYPQLGFISLQTTLNPSDILAVSYEYTYNGKTYKVGEFSQDMPTVNTNGDSTAITSISQNVLFLKLLKGQAQNTSIPMWDLMMKNIYSLGAYQISPTDFKLDVTYIIAGSGEKRFLNQGSVQGVPLLRLLNLDRLNNNNDPVPDGIFDFVQNVTIIPQTGRLIFPVVEPFGNDLRAKFQNTQDDQYIANQFVYQELYDKTKAEAQQFPEKNRFNIKGTYKSSSASEIYLGAFNLPTGSVKVISGGQELRENVDYSVDYNLGRVKIINEGILNSGQPIKIKFENSAFMGLGQVRTLLGSRFDYYINPNMSWGATWLHLNERPFTQKVLVGDDPISNGIIGTDFHFNKDNKQITQFLDKLPFYNTKAKSNITLTAEFAKLNPGHSPAIGKEGQVYIDDFEGAQSNYDIKFPSNSWVLASTPRDASRGSTGTELFPESKLNSLDYGYNRGKLSWYNIDPYFTRSSGIAANLTSNDEQSNLFVREIEQKEIFPNKELEPGTPLTLTTLDLYFNPKQRGPYNYDITGMNADGSLKNPAKRWGGIMRSIDYSDFEASNIEFIQFWVMDPYSEGGTPSANSGDLYFNLGTVSEDILKDSRKYYENGMPRSADDKAAKQKTIWGYVPTNQQPITNTFDNSDEVRLLQDVGYDGMNNDSERVFYQSYINSFPAGSKAKVAAEADPSNDDYHYYRGSDYDNEKKPIVERYRKFNNPQGNSPTDKQSPETYSTAATPTPETEDINRDNSLSETEDYFQYRIHLTPDMQVGSNFVNDIKIANVKLKNGTTASVKYYQFKIPITNYEKKVGMISDFKSIRFIRMYLNGFSDSLTLRFAKLELVRNQWRRYIFSLNSPGEIISTDHDGNTYFNVTSVNLEENATKQPVGYVLLPGIQRTLKLTSQTNVRENEQSMALQVCNLLDGDARAVYKNINLDMRNFKRIKLFVHAESKPGEKPLNNHDVYGFIRLGADFSENYYELSIPLKITDAGATADLNVWPEQNDILLELDSLSSIKQQRNASGKAINAPYRIKYKDGSILTIVGNPNLGLTRTVMLGVRNPKRGSTIYSDDDAQAKCAEVWFNELRLDGFDEQGGYAALVRADVRLADLGNINVTGNMHTIGYGSLEQKLADRFRDNFFQYNASTNLELGKLLPENWGIKLPFYASYSEQISNPKFDPFQLDVKLKDELTQAKALRGKDYADSIKKTAQDYTSIFSYNLTNVKINRPKKTKLGQLNLPTNIENFNVSYSFTETFKRNPTYQGDDLKKYRAGIGYNYAIKPKFITPFKWIPWKTKYINLVKDFNFNLLPTNVSLKADLDRQFGEANLRKISPDEVAIAPTFNKYFRMTRTYGIKYDLARSISIDFNAINNSRIDEPFGRIDTKEKRDTIITRIKQLKRTTDYHHDLTVNYTLPFSKFPLTDWINSRATYSAGYTWLTAPLTMENLGNTIQNNQNKQINGDFNFNNLYNKSRLLKRYNSKTLIQQAIEKKNGTNNKNSTNGGNSTKKEGAPANTVNKVMKQLPAKVDSKFYQEFYSLDEDIEISEEDEIEYVDINNFDASQYQLIDVMDQYSYDVLSKKDTAKTSTKKVAVKKKKKKKAKVLKVQKEKPLNPLLYVILKPMMSLKRASINYSEDAGTQLPGYFPRSRYLGLDTFMRYPGYDFIGGLQPSPSIMNMYGGYDILSKDFLQNTPFTQRLTKTLNVTASLEPMTDFKIDLTFMRNSSKNLSENYKYQAATNNNPGYFDVQSKMINGSFSVSFFGLNTFFIQPDADNVSPLFKEFERKRKFISKELGLANPYSQDTFPGHNEYYKGYGPYSQSVLIPAFLATYTSPQMANLTIDQLFNILPKPNWRINYNGLTKLPGIKKVITSATINHTYNSTFNIGSFTTAPDFLLALDNAGSIWPIFIDTVGQNFVNYYNVPSISITEQLAPLIGIDITWKNNITTKLDIKFSRNLNMSFVDYQLSEARTQEFTFGGGYKRKGTSLPVKYQGKPVKLDNDLTFRLDLTYRNDLTMNYKLDQNLNTPTRGMKSIGIAPYIDYVVNNKLNIRIFYDYRRTIPATSASFPITAVKAGVKIRFSLTP